jgi:hypothetical protein
MAKKQELVRGGARLARFDPRDDAWLAEEGEDDLGVFLDPPWAPRQQGSVPCCVPIAVCGAMEILRPQAEPLSALHLYWQARPTASGMGLVDVRTALRAAQQTGVCTESLLAGCAPGGPAVDPEDALRPPAVAVASALRIGKRMDDDDVDAGYGRVRALYVSRSWRAALRAGFPIIAVIPLVPEHAALRDAADPLLSQVSPSPVANQHAVLVTGVWGERFRMRDAQGLSFGQAGDWWLDARLADSGFVTESWVVRKVVDP